MRVIKFFLWTSCAVGFGIFLASGNTGGKTPLEQLKEGWKDVRVEGLKKRAGDALDALKDAKNTLSSGREIEERHSPEAKEAVNKLIAKRGQQR